MISKKDYIFGIRPIIEAIESGKTIDTILIKNNLSGELFSELIDKASAHRIPIKHVPIERLNRITLKNHQGAIAFMSAVDYFNLEQMLPALYEDGANPFFVILDGITDVRNFGAIARTCECAGVNAIIIPERNSVSVNADAIKTSAGALNHLPVCRYKTALEAVRYLKESGCMIAGAAGQGAVNYTDADYTGPLALVLGSEDMGISRDILRLCDKVISIPEFGEINSLNVSVAGGILIYEVVRQRLNDNQTI
ncbi:MAG: 23S rRNA (guanosine(2251)-2'-O)-methyltransferase RlmB [Muribaculaceae bacterium]|nr:23S rRNA (guanosine(2251)-2'-O)-methyltransferase RlmB [Muribaculaceae bacterium]